MNPKTFVLTVERPIARFDATAKHLDEMGVVWERFNGMDNQLCKLSPIETFDLDRAGERIGSKHIAATLTHWACWKVCSHLPDDLFWILEYDVRMSDNWREQYAEAMANIPEDFDILFIGHCCLAGRETKHISGNIYEVKWPLCGHGLCIRKKALPTLLREHQTIRMPLDIAMYYTSLPQLKVYCMVPPLVTQHGTFAPP